MRRRCLVLRGRRAVLERTRRHHQISFEIVGAPPVLHLNFKLLVPSPVPLVPIGANVRLVKKVLLLLLRSIVCAAIALVGNTKIKMVSLARHAPLIPLVLLARNNPTCLQGRRTVLVTVAETDNTKPMVLLLAACVIIVRQDMSSILFLQIARNVLVPLTRLKVVLLRSLVLRGPPAALENERRRHRHRREIVGVRIAPMVNSNLLDLIRVPVALLIHRRVVKEHINQFHQLLLETVGVRLALLVIFKLLNRILVLFVLRIKSVALVSGDHQPTRLP